MFSAEVLLHRYSLAQIFEDPYTTLQNLVAMTKSQKAMSLVEEICMRKCSSGPPRVISDRTNCITLPGKHNRPRDFQRAHNPARHDESGSEPPQKYFKEQPSHVLNEQQYVEGGSVYTQHEPHYTEPANFQEHSHEQYDQFEEFEEQTGSYNRFHQRPKNEAFSAYSSCEQNFGNDYAHHNGGASRQFAQKRNPSIFTHDSRDQSYEMDTYHDGYESYSPGDMVQPHENYDDSHIHSPDRQMPCHRDDQFYSPDYFHTPENVVPYHHLTPGNLRSNSVLKKRRLGLEKPRVGEQQTRRKLFVVDAFMVWYQL